MMMQAELASFAPFFQREWRWSEMCGNRECATGWLRLFRNHAPRFEEKWACSEACMEQIVAGALRSQMDSWEPTLAKHSLRMPLGLILLSRGWITRRELQTALAAQREAGTGRIGEWLCRLFHISEETIAKALGIQWNCAVLAAGTPEPERFSSPMPIFLQELYGFSLVRPWPEGPLYLTGRHCAEQATARAVEHMLREPVHAAFCEDSRWRLRGEGITDPAEMEIPGREGVVARICERLERSRCCDARLARVHDHLWLRMWSRGRLRAQDVVFPLQARSLLRAG